ncbi:MAG: phenylalanine--tRNA ligase subunit beta [Zetaproteobacteria bacterium]|nr:phenylalanine--tRNA ligase subunit beta [Zetaproteobacteria bacterium]
MKISLSWLQDYVDVTASPQVLADTLVRLGHEVESVESPRQAVFGVVVGLIESKVQHPNADRLSLLKVNVGGESLLEIVCGASNMGVGDKIPVATVGTQLPGGLTIKKGKIRGETSCGMCCSETELGLADHSDGLLILPEDAPIGMQLGEYLGFETALFDLSITPNRGDCMSVRGIARDLAADADLPLKVVGVDAVAVDAAVALPVVAMQAIDDCSIYMARRIEGVTVGNAPEWLQARLRAAGQRSVNGVVDVLNYIMLDMGQPMHAFDAEKLSGDITVRHAQEGEPFDALDGRHLDLATHNLVIADDEKVIALAGVMGSEETGVSENTQTIVLESAYFRAAGISTTRRGYAMVSEASMRFERGVDPLMVEVAMERASQMIVHFFGGSVGAVRSLGNIAEVANVRELTVDLARVELRLGITLPEGCDGVLARMGFDLSHHGSMLRIGVPSFRHDVTQMEDISEEFARIVGFDAIPTILPTLHANVPLPIGREVADAVHDGAMQVIGYAFISEEQQRLFVEDDGLDIRLQNPISAEMAVMRRSVWPGLLAIAQRNLNRQQSGVCLVEHGRVYVRAHEEVVTHHEHDRLAWLMAGSVDDDQWFAKGRCADFYDLKGLVESWLSKRQLSARFVVDDHVLGLQAGQTAAILVGRNKVGTIGRVDASIADTFDITASVYVAEIDLAALPMGKAMKFQPLAEFPSVERDLVFLFDRGVEADAIVQTVVKAGGALLTHARIFDHYVGQGVPEGKVSLGVRFTLQSTDRTLSQTDAEAVFNAVIEAVTSRFSASLRG